ncbi:MAG TPA: hypothetical protein VM282_19110 [Acidimicrobiales bacterium]|nr:hypothetical protein [Acidimicrobiales bacterium]
MRDLLIGSGLVQLSVGVWLGWVVLGFAAGKERVGPFVARRPTLQCHLDNLMMGGLQLAIAGAVPDLPTVPTWLILFGSWVNPQLFLAMAIGFSASGPEAYAPATATTKRSPLRRVTRTVRRASFAALTVGYPWLAVESF